MNEMKKEKAGDAQVLQGLSSETRPCRQRRGLSSGLWPPVLDGPATAGLPAAARLLAALRRRGARPPVSSSLKPHSMKPRDG